MLNLVSSFYKRTSEKGSNYPLLTPAVRGALFKALSCLCFAGVYGCVHFFSLSAKEAGLPPLPAPELAFFETFFALLFILPWALKEGARAFKITRPSLYIGRALVVALGIILWFTALSKMDLVQVVAFKYTTPLFTLLGAHLFLKEKCGWGRGIAISISFMGALLMTGNDLFKGTTPWQEVTFLALFPLGATLCYAFAAIFGKKQAKNDSPQTITLYLLLLTLPLLAMAALPEWVTPLSWQWPWLIFMGGLLACGYIFLSHAYVTAEITYLIPVSFTRLIAAAAIGMAFFHEWPTPWTWLGTFLILGSTIALCHYEIRFKFLLD